MNFVPTEEKLKERVKELTCLYEISKAISRPHYKEKEVLKKIITSTKKAWKFSADAIVEVQLPNYNFSTSKFDVITVSQISTISISNQKTGFIKVHYPQQYSVDDFLPEEQKLLDNIAFEIGNYIEKFQNLEKEQVLLRTIERIDRLSILGEMTAGIAHELNTPLGNILGYAELIKSMNKDPEIDSDISTVINSVIYSREIVKKLMFFSREMPQQLQLTEIKPLVTFALAFLKKNFQEKHIKSEVFFENDNIIAKIDSVQITQVLFNLIVNAIYASGQKSTIKIVVENDAQNLSITVEDQGTGIPDTLKQKIFEPFFTTKPINDGCGLGLSVVHGIIKNHNGEICVRDNQPNGTVFLIKLPLN